MLRRNVVTVLLVLVVGGLLVWGFEAAGEQKAKDAELFEEADRFIEVIRLVQKQYVRDVDTRKMFRDAIDGMLAGLDPFSNYIPEDELAEFNKSTRGRFGGIGIQIGMRRGLLTVISPLEGTPAYRAGVLAGDLILEIDGKTTEGLRLDEAVKILTGDPGTKVAIKVRHITGETEDIAIMRAIIEVPTIKGVRRDDAGEWVYWIDPDKKIAYVRVTSFVEKTTEDLRKVAEGLLGDGMKGLVLDLRFDPGGILKTAVEMTDLFVPEGVIVKTKGRTTPYWEATATRQGTLPYFPMVVLVNQFSASASEIVSGALQDHHRAIVVGERTFGKGSVQNVIPLQGEDAALKLTTSKYYLPGGRNIHREEEMTDADEWGIVPDILVPMKPEEYVAILRARQEADIIRNQRDGAPESPDAAPGAPKPEGAEPEGAKPKGAEPDGAKPKGAAPEGAKPKGAAPPAAPGPPMPGEDLPEGEAPDAAKTEPAVDRQLERAVDVLRSMDVIEKYLQKKPA